MTCLELDGLRMHDPVDNKYGAHHDPPTECDRGLADCAVDLRVCGVGANGWCSTAADPSCINLDGRHCDYTLDALSV